ncbi:MAG: serine hydrolase [Acidimicrobiales bacterium]
MVAMYDIPSGAEWVLNPNLAPQPTASIVKVDIMATLLYQANGARRSLTASESELIPPMIEVSSNSAATSMWYAAGGGNAIGSFNSMLGMSSTTMSTCVVCGSFPWPGWGLSTTRPVDQLALLKQLVMPSNLISKDQQHYALNLMSHIEPSLQWGVSQSVPSSATVAMKTGDLPLNSSDTDWQVNSLGWVDAGSHNYLMAMLSTGNPSLEYGVDTLNEISAMVWQEWDDEA